MMVISSTMHSALKATGANKYSLRFLISDTYLDVSYCYYISHNLNFQINKSSENTRFGYKGASDRLQEELTRKVNVQSENFVN